MFFKFPHFPVIFFVFFLGGGVSNLSSLSDMNYISLRLLLQISLATALPAVYSGMGKGAMGAEPLVTDFAVLTGNNLDGLPKDFTVCSSIASVAFLGIHSPFQLIYENGKPWITVYFLAAQKYSTQHRMTFMVLPLLKAVNL